MINILLSAVSGGLLVLVFPKPGLYLLAYVSLVPLLFAVRRARSVRSASFLGFACGLVYFGGVLYWINVLSKWAGIWANIAYVSLVIFQALFIAAAAALIKVALGIFPGYSMLLVPLIWTAVEWVRSLGPYGVTGGGLGYSQADILPILQSARLFSSYGISFLIVLVNEALARTVLERRARYLITAFCLFSLVFLAGYLRMATYRETGRPMKVAVIQANVPQDVKLDYGLAYDIVSAHETASRKALAQKPDVIIWPETAVTIYLFETRTLLAKVKKLVRESRTCYLIGTPYREKDRIYNSVAAFDRRGEVVGRYDKQRLVPFGEYLPLRPLFYPMLGENPMFAEDYNSNPRPSLLETAGAKAAVAVCFESTLPYLVRNRVRKGADFIVVATNDAWFFRTPALEEHLAASRLRAVENNMYVVQAANTGISAIIDPLGRVVKRAEVDRTEVLSGTIYFH